jgi:hypothetical protein
VADVQITFLAKPGCHLCDDARVIVRDVLAGLADHPDAPAVTYTELSILDNPALFDEFAEEIPVVMIDGAVHTIWRVEPDRLRTAILERA